MMTLDEITEKLKVNGVLSKEFKLLDAPSSQAVYSLLTRENVKARATWGKERQAMAAKQIIMRNMGIEVGQIDGLYGPVTMHAFHDFGGRAKTREQIQLENKKSLLLPPPAPVRNNWPLQKDVERYYGAIGKNHTTVAVPWKMRVSYDPTKSVSKITIHERCADSLKRVLARVADAYTEDQIKALGLDLFGGSYNPRKMRGGNAWSMHAWAIAIDFDPDRNQFNWGRDRARLAKGDADIFWRIFEEENWVSLGRQRNFDWMHVQAARL